MRSTDFGLSWTLLPSYYNGVASWTSVAYGNGNFVALGSILSYQYADAKGQVSLFMKSSDYGTTWKGYTINPKNSSTFFNSWVSIAYGNGIFVAVALSGTNRTMRSIDDGVTWTRYESSGESNEWIYVAYGNGLFVAVARSGTRVTMKSVDGITWQGIAEPTGTSTWKCVTYGNEVFVAVAKDGPCFTMAQNPGSI